MKKAMFFSGWGLENKDIFTALFKQYDIIHLVDWNFFSPSKFPNLKNEHSILQEQAQEYDLIAFSFGGFEALKLASKYSVNKLILYACFANFCNEQELLIKKKINLMINKINKHQYQQLIGDFYCEIGFDYQQERKFYNKYNLITGLNLLLTEDVSHCLPTITSNTIIFHGENDSLVKKEKSNYLFQNIENSSINILDNKKHYCF